MPDDLELTSFSTKEASFSLGSTRSMPRGGGGAPASHASIFASPSQRGRMAGWINGFRQDPHSRVTMGRAPGARRSRTSTDGSTTAVDVEEGVGMLHGPRYFDMHAAALMTANPLLARELKGRHLQMIAIGGSIGMPLAPLRARLVVTPLLREPMLTWTNRDWPLRRLGQSALPRRPGFGAVSLHLYRRDALLYGASARRAGRGLSRGRLVLGFLDEVPRSGLGLRYGLEVSVLSSPIPWRLSWRFNAACEATAFNG